MTENRFLALIIGLFIGLGLIYALTTPVFEASDELWHYPMVRHLADGNALPIQTFDPAQAGPWKQEASQPPLYYYLGAALTFWIDTSDMDSIRWLNPHVDNGVLTEDGNINLVIHDPTVNPYEGTLLAVRIVRICSVLLGALTVYLTYRIAREAVSGRAEIALGAAAVNAFLPMFLFISGAVNNDNLVIMLASLALLLMIQLVRDQSLGDKREIRHLLFLGVVIGLGALTKITALGLLPLAGFAVFIRLWRRFDRPMAYRGLLMTLGKSLIKFGLILGPVLLIAGWWYYRNTALYGDWSGWNAFIAVLGQRAHPASLAQLWDERWGFMLSYWGLFGGLNVAMVEWIYQLLNLVAVLAALGFGYYFIRLVVIWAKERAKPIKNLAHLIWNLLRYTEEQIGIVLCLLWSLAVILGLVRWATVTWSSQGRLVFSAISALSTLMVLGLVGWLPRRPAQIGVGILAAFMFIVSLLAPWLWIQPAYQLPEEPISEELRIVTETFNDQIRLKGFGISDETLKPGEEIEVLLDWQVVEEMNRDWSVFVHLNDPIVGAPIAQRDMYPGQGLLATSLMRPGQELLNRYILKIPDSVIAPADLSLVAGLYDFETGERLPIGDGRDSVELTTIQLEAKQGEVPNPLKVNFEDKFELVGFWIEPRQVNPGGEINLILYWRLYAETEQDYTFFAQIVSEDTTRYASHDLAQPTSTWPADEIIPVELALTLDDATPPSVYPLIIGIYTRPADGSFDRLQTKTPEGRLTDDYYELTKIRVDATTSKVPG